MKYIKSLLTVAVIFSLIIFISCGGNGKKPPAEPQGKAKSEELASGDWSPTSVTLDGTGRTEWDNFSLSFGTNSDFTGGSYQATGVPTDDGASDVFRTSGTWAFVENSDGTLNLDRIIKDGDTNNLVSVTVGANQLTLSFTVPAASGRTEGFDGLWIFTFSL